MTETELSSNPPHSRIKGPEATFFKCLAAVLLIYALFGRWGAHFGIPLTEDTGIYIGDMVFAFGLIVLMVNGTYMPLLNSPVGLPWIFFVLWNAAQTLPYIPQYGLLAVRDAALWGYSFFALIVASLLVSRPDCFTPLVIYYRRFAWTYPFLVPVIFIADSIIRRFDPAILIFKGTDGLVHVIGSVALVYCGFASVSWLWWSAVAADFLLVGSRVRGGMLAFLLGALALWLVTPGKAVRVARLVGALGVLVALAVLVDFKVDVGEDRTASVQQIMSNVVSVFTGDTGIETLDGTREWRTQWWDTIVGYTVYGPYFLTGKGYGINLADEDGFQGTLQPGEAPTRSPHNSHLTFLARAGVPGLLLWAVLQLTWVWEILWMLFFARRTGRTTAAGLLTIVLVYWTSIMAAAATDVTLEGPMLGVWFWTIFGVGIAATVVLRDDPNFFESGRDQPLEGEEAT